MDQTLHQAFNKVEEWRASLSATLGVESWLTRFHTINSLVRIRENIRESQMLRLRLDTMELSERARQIYQSDRAKAVSKLERGRDFDPKF